MSTPEASQAEAMTFRTPAGPYRDRIRRFKLVVPATAGEGHMRRREFIAMLGSAAVTWPFAARSEQSIRRIGGLLVGNADIDAFRTTLSEELRKFGYIEGGNLVFEFRSEEEKIDLLPKLAAELVAIKVDVIVAIYTPCALEAQHATREIPIVVLSRDPVVTGLV